MSYEPSFLSLPGKSSISDTSHLWFTFSKFLIKSSFNSINCTVLNLRDSEKFGSSAFVISYTVYGKSEKNMQMMLVEECPRWTGLHHYLAFLLDVFKR